MDGYPHPSPIIDTTLFDPIKLDVEQYGIMYIYIVSQFLIVKPFVNTHGIVQATWSGLLKLCLNFGP